MTDRIHYPEKWSQADRAALDAMFAKARSEGLWFFHGGMSGPIWFSPADLEAEQKKGSFVWGAVNWQLRNPIERVAEVDQAILALNTERASLLSRMANRS